MSQFSKTLMLREDLAEFLKGSMWFFILYQWHTQILLNVRGEAVPTAQVCCDVLHGTVKVVQKQATH